MGLVFLKFFLTKSVLEACYNNFRFCPSNLSLSEYIESLMSLSLTERKMLATIQRNRKLAFKQANSAAAVIQTAWRRYFLFFWLNINYQIFLILRTIEI